VIVPQADFKVAQSDNGGWEGTQSFLAKKSSIVAGGALDQLFVRGRSITALDPNCPAIHAGLGLVKADQSDHAPGIVKLECTFSGYAGAGSNGSSGEESTVPTYSMRKDIEEIPLNEHRKWAAMSDGSKARLGVVMSGTSAAVFNMAEGTYGYFDDNGDVFTELTGGFWATPTGDELGYARLIAQDKMTAKRPAWTWTVRTEGSNGFTNTQLNSAGKIVSNPVGSPPTPSGGYCWFFVGPDQEQSGEGRFVKDLTYQLIPDTDDNRFLYD